MFTSPSQVKSINETLGGGYGAKPNNQSFKKWFNFYKEHKFIPAQELGLTLQDNSESQAFRLYIHWVKNIRFSVQEINPLAAINIAQNDYILKFQASFFTQAKQRFFGRTYSSRQCKLIYNSQRELELEQPLAIFYVSKLDLRMQPILIIEMQVAEISHNNQVTQRMENIGFIAIDPFKECSPQTLNILKGSARSLMIEGIRIGHEHTDSVIQFDIQSCNEAVLNVKHLLIENIPIGTDEQIPGIQGRHLNLKEVQMQAEPTTRLFLTNIVLYVPDELDNEIISLVNKFALKKYGEVNKDAIQSRINARRLQAYFHNGWTACNVRGFENYQVLTVGPLKPIQKTEEDIQLRKGQLMMRSLEYRGIMDIEGIFLDEFGLLILELQFEVQLEIQNRQSEHLLLPIAWCPYFLSNENLAGELILSEELIKGPGKNLQNKKFADINPLHQLFISVSMSCQQELNIPIGGDMQQSYITKSGVFPIDQSNQQQLMKQTILAQQQEQFALKQKDQQIQRLVQELQETQQKLKVTQIQPQLIQQEGYQLEESQRQKHIQALLDQQQSLTTMKDQNELTEIKRMIKDLMIVKQEVQPSYSLKQENAEIQDQIDQNKWKIIDGLQAIQKKAQQQQPNVQFINQEYGKDLTKQEKAVLISHNIQGLMDNVIIDKFDHLQYHQIIQMEMEDSKKASIFIIQLLGIRPQHQIFQNKYTTQLSSQFYNENYYIPDRLFATINFYDHPLFKTEVLAFETTQNYSKQKMLEQQNFLVLVKENFLKGSWEGKESAYKFDIDPSVMGKAGLHCFKNFINYLYKKTINIDLWDADSLMLFGSIKIPLRQMLKGGRQIVTCQKEYNIIDQSFNSIKGSLLIQLQNIGKTPKVVDFALSDYQKMDNQYQSLQVINPQGQGGALKKKVKSQLPLKLPSDYQQYSSNLKLTENQQVEYQTNPQKRIEERIKRHKLKILSSYSDLGQQLQGDTLKQRLIQEISIFKEQKKEFYIKNVLNEYLTQNIHVTVQYGQTELIPFTFTNKENREMSFQVTIQDPDAKYLQQNLEMKLITNPMEWKFWVEKSKGQLQKPPEWDMLQTDGVFILKSNETVTILFKFLTFRAQASENFEQQAQTEEENFETKQKYIQSRSIQVFINVLKDRIYGGFNLIVTPQNQIVDHTFRFYERENRMVELFLPAFVNVVQTPLTQPILHITYPHAAVEWADDKTIRLSLKTLPNNNILIFNMLAYENQYYSEILGNWIIEINSLSGVDLQLNMGQLATAQLTYQGDIPRICKLFSSLPLTAYFPSPFDKPFQTVPGRMNILPLNVKSYNETQVVVQVHLVDMTNKELVNAWLIKLNTNVPNVSKIFDIQCRVGQESYQKFIYHNKTSQWALFEFTSSSPDILQVIESKIGIQGGDKESIRVKIPQQNEQGMATVYVFACDSDEKIFDCMLFKIHFYY